MHAAVGTRSVSWNMTLLEWNLPTLNTCLLLLLLLLRFVLQTHTVAFVLFSFETE